MLSLSQIKRRAKEIAEASRDENAELAQLVADLAKRCEGLEDELGKAKGQAQQALTEVRSR